ncbi:complement C5 isoform X2 [Trichomycterus rosablanca]|uniref:complement C5 isoform X2 n=1 Tax=Trichomycterus rosablanca TaxID=2290929 RepID=UPI002F35F6FE
MCCHGLRLRIEQGLLCFLFPRFLITAPKVLRVDATETVVVQLFGYDQETKVNLYLKASKVSESKIFASQSVMLNGYNNYQALASLRIFPNIDTGATHVYLQATSDSFTEFEKIPIIRDNGFLFIQTDKPLYTPEQHVEVRVYSLNQEFRKSNRPVLLTFKDPDGIRMEIIEMNDINGVKPLLPPFKIPLKPKFGSWKIEATYANDFTTTAKAEFEVKEYVLPSISLRIQPEDNYISAANFDAFKLNIFAKYVSGEPVNTANVFLRFGYISNNNIVMIPSSLKYYKMDDGQLEVVLNIKNTLSNMDSGPQDLWEMDNHYLRVAVLLKESAGGISQEAVLSNVKFVNVPFTLSLIATPPFIKPSLPYNIRVLVTDVLGKPVRGVPVKASGTLTNNVQEHDTLKFSGYKTEVTEMSSHDGIANFICNIPDNAKSALFTFETDNPEHPPESQAQLKLSTVAYTSINQRYLYIHLPLESSAFEVDDYAHIKIHFYHRHYLPLKIFSYQVISKGKVVKFDTVLRVSESVQSISFKVTSDMVPFARLLVYYLLSGEQKAELVADSVWFNVKAKCINGLDVSLKAESNLYKPKDKLDLSVMTKSASEKSLVALSAVDMALYDLKANDNDPLNKVLRHFELSDLGCGGGGGRDNADVFSRAGLTFLTNANVKASIADEKCTAVLRPKRSTYSYVELYEEKNKTAVRTTCSTDDFNNRIEAYANRFKDYKSCCLEGANTSPTLETCKELSSRLNFNDICKRAFSLCCSYAQNLRNENKKVIVHFRPAKEDSISSVRRKRSAFDYKDLMDDFAKKFMDYSICCKEGSDNIPTLETCEDRANRLKQNNLCKTAFRVCCQKVKKLMQDNKDVVILGRSEAEFLQDVKAEQVRSYFPESWLWEEHEIDRYGLLSVPKVLPDSLTTWEIKAVGMFNNGICVADPLQVRVFQPVSVDVPLPYSMVRGEQIELKGSIYNHYKSNTKYSVTLAAKEGVCVFHGTLLSADGDPHVNTGWVEGNSLALVRFYIMALEVGTHELRFTLTTRWGKETLVKTLRVVPEGIREERFVGKRLDPNGIFGKATITVELGNTLPSNIVPKSTVERLLTINGDVLGELLSIGTDPKGIMQLSNLPKGSGEVELMAILPIFYAYDYLEQTQQWDKMAETVKRTDLKRRMNEGIISIMSFKSKLEDSFSVWMNREPSTWLTALVVKTLANVNKYVTVDHNMLSKTVSWLIIHCQNPDGSFTEKSSYKPIKLMGEGADVAEQKVFITSFVLIGIKNALEVPKSNIVIYKNAVEKAADYVSSHATKVNSLYVRALAAYALTLADRNSKPADILYDKLMKESQIKGNPAIVRFWEVKGSPQDPNRASAMTVETTVYMLLTTLMRGNIEYAKPILNWLTNYQQNEGGFYSTQDAVLTLEALTKYSILVQSATLDMNIEMFYRKKGKIGIVSLTQKKPVGKPIEIVHAEDIILKTGYSDGVSFATLKTVYYKMADSNNNCFFDLAIDVHSRDTTSTDPMQLLPRIVACAKYKPHENEIETESGHTVMDINLPTGVSPIESDLKRFRDGLESRISNYEITGDRVILQIDSIPSDSFYCVGFRVQEVFKTGMNSASVFKVYEYHNSASQCTKLYYSESNRLLRLCDGNHCQCMAAECCNFKANLDPTITLQQRMRDVCKDGIKYVLKVKITSVEAEGEFQIYNANVESVIENGLTDIKVSTEVSFVKKATCSSTNLEIGKQYLIWGAEIMQVRLNRSFRYKFPLDSQAWVEWWPYDSDCQTDSCNNYINVLYDFELDYPTTGCSGV